MKTSKLQQLTSIAANSNSSIRIYICIIPEEEQRRFYISLLSQIFGWNQILSQPLSKSDSFLLQLPLLFNPREILHLQSIENVSSSAKPHLYGFLQSYPSRLILSGSSFGHCVDLYAKCNENSLLLNLTQESKWEKKNRLKEYCHYEVARAGKSITSDALDYIIQEKEDSIVGLQSELRKVICQAGAKETIQKSDVTCIVSASPRDDWKTREHIAFGLDLEYSTPYLPKDFFPFLQQIRYLIDLAFFYLHAQESSAGSEALQKRFPYVKGNLATHYANLLQGLSIQYCIQAKEILFESEFTAKSSATPTPVLINHLIAKLQCLRKSTNLS
ncbi:MAG: hypothetical protein ACRCSV_03885 [Chlamydiales bacterium]